MTSSYTILVRVGVGFSVTPVIAEGIDEAKVTVTVIVMVAINKTPELYELDFYAWTQQQAKLLQEGKWDCLDIPNLIEEIECLGKQERRERGSSPD